jgi:hypothetical protein
MFISVPRSSGHEQALRALLAKHVVSGATVANTRQHIFFTLSRFRSTGARVTQAQHWQSSCSIYLERP